MKKTTLFLLSIVLLTGIRAQDVDYTSSILNSDFEYATAADAANNLTVKPTYIVTGSNTINGQKYQWKPLTQSPVTTFYGWTLDFAKLGNSQSQGINNDAYGLHGSTMLWINGASTNVLAENFEFYQTLTGLPAGTYKVQCLLGVENTTNHTSQRIFANNNVQYFGRPTDYVANNNLNISENYSFAGHVPATGTLNGITAISVQEMKVYTTIAANNDLKIGIRTGGKNANGQTGTSNTASMWGWFKVDYFRLTKIDAATAADATLNSLSLSAGTLTFDPAITNYNVIVPEGTTTVTPTATANVVDATVTGTEPVTLTNGTGSSNITVKALDGTTTNVYKINYIASNATEDIKPAASKFNYSIKNNTLIVNGVSSYAIFNTNGVKIADIKENTIGTSVQLPSGVYIIKTNIAKSIKINIH